MGAKLEYCGNRVEIEDFKHSEKDEKLGNPYNCSFNIRIISDSFSGLADGCEYDYKEWKSFIAQLKDLLNFKTSEVTLREIGYGGTIRLIGDTLGHVEVSGLVYGKHMTNSLQFEFTVDQTVLPDFIKELDCL